MAFSRGCRDRRMAAARQWGVPSPSCLRESDPFPCSVKQANLGSRFSYRHGGRAPLTTDLVKAPPIKVLNKRVAETWSLTNSPY
jgi:hypothetical protein